MAYVAYVRKPQLNCYKIYQYSIEMLSVRMGIFHTQKICIIFFTLNVIFSRYEMRILNSLARDYE